jgi:type IV pilus assembly protein PilW
MQMRAFSNRHRGFSLVEVLIAMVIALLGTIIIFQVFAVSEGIRRTSTSGGDAQQNGLLALFSIERDARMAGFGINFLPMLGCTVQAHDEQSSRDFTFPFVAALIADGPSGTPDSITLAYGNSGSMVVPAKLTALSTSVGTVIKVDNRFGFKLGDLIMVGEQGVTKNCTMRQVTTLPDNPAEDVGNDAGTYKNAQGNDTIARYNKVNGVGTAYNAWDNAALSGGRLFSLGATPSVLTYTIADSKLVLRNLTNSDNFITVADGIVQLQALYGKDTDGDGNVDLWEATMPVTPTATDWSRVMALRIAVVARSDLAEKPTPPSTTCNTTTATSANMPKWTGINAGGTPVAFDLSADPNWQCYRYRVFETTVPVRNNFWLQN